MKKPRTAFSFPLPFFLFLLLSAAPISAQTLPLHFELLPLNHNLGWNEAAGLNNLGMVAGTGVWDTSASPPVAIRTEVYAQDINDLGQIVPSDFPNGGAWDFEGDSISGTEGGHGHEARFANNQGDHVGIYSLYVREWLFGELMEEVGRPGETKTHGKHHSYYGFPGRALGGISAYHDHIIYHIVPPSEDYPLHRIDSHVESYADVVQHFDPVGIDDEGFIPGLQQQGRDLPPIPRVFHTSNTDISKSIPGAATVFSTSDRGIVAGLTTGQEPALWQRASDGSGYFLAAELPRPPDPGKLTFIKANDYNLIIGVTDREQPWIHLKRSWLWWKNDRNRWQVTEVLPLAPESWQGNNRELVLRDINQAGQFCGTLSTYRISAEEGRNFSDKQSGQAVLISFPRARLAVDANRDRQIVFPGDPQDRPADQTSPQEPFRFWLNNDEDRPTTFVQPSSLIAVVPENPKPLVPDSADDRILHARDLEDFAPLAIDLGPLLQQLKSGSKHLGLKWKPSTGNPAIRLFSCQDDGDPFAHLTDAQAAETQLRDHGIAVAPHRGPQFVRGPQPFVFSPDQWRHLSSDRPVASFLFEAVREGQGELILVLLDKRGRTEERELARIHLDLMDVKKMYERPTSDPARIPAPYNRPNGPVYPPVNVVDGAGKHTFSKPWDETPQAIVFVHGWNVDADWYAMASDTMFKRLWWQGYKGRYQSFRWRPFVDNEWVLYSGEFNRSEHLAFYTGAALQVHVNRIQGRFQTLGLVAHSMGNIVASTALRRGARVDNFLLMEAAVPAGAYDLSGGISYGPDGQPALSGVNGYERFWQAEGDRKQTPDYFEDVKGYRGYFKDIRQNVNGSIVNFYNPLDYALATGGIFFGVKETNWEANQVEYKPDPIDGDPAGARIQGYDYYPGNPLNQQAELRYFTNGRPAGLRRRWVTDPWEMMAFVARPRSKAVGAVGFDGELRGTSNDNFPNNMTHVDLRALSNFGRARTDHSGQFNRPIQQVWGLYEVIFRRALQKEE